MCILPIRKRKGGVILGYAIQDWQDLNIACEGNNPERMKPVHYPCVYYKGIHETNMSFKARIILEHTFLRLSMFVGL